jgi:RNA polymerase sigma factor (sigma-70 family)
VQGDVATAGRKRAAIELIAREGGELSQTARRYSLCAEDAEDACQRALEILLLKAPSERPRELIRWTKTVVKHEALAIRRNRERLLGAPRSPRGAERDADDPIASIPAGGGGPDEHVELRERIARSREALRSLKPAELRSLTLLAAGYSYAEIGEITGFSQTKVNRCLAEGRERYRKLLAGSEDGVRCAEMSRLLSAFCDGEASAEESAAAREHLRACARCRATMRAYRAAPATVAALAPSLPVPRSLFDRAQELLNGLHSRLPGSGGTAGAGIAQVATAGGTRGAGMAALAKALAICAGTVGGAAACVATGVAPMPIGLAQQQAKEATIERVSVRAIEESAPPAVEYQPTPEPEPRHPPADEQGVAPESAQPAPTADAGAVEYAPAPAEAAPSPAPASGEPAGASSGSAAGEFGP